MKKINEYDTIFYNNIVKNENTFFNDFVTNKALIESYNKDDYKDKLVLYKKLLDINNLLSDIDNLICKLPDNFFGDNMNIKKSSNRKVR